jgi:hypothetical protein
MGDKRIPPDREIVTRFVEHLRAEGFPDLQVDSWSEDDHPGQSVVEAIAGSLAIEHTSVDTLPEQRRIGEQFIEALGILDYVPASARISINVPYELVTVGSDWEAYRLALAHWIITTARSRAVRPRHEFSHSRLTGVFKRRMIHAVRAGQSALCWREGGPHKGHSVNQGRENPVSGSYRLGVNQSNA